MEATITNKIVEKCQVCGHAPLESILFMGYLPPEESFCAIGERPKEEPSYPTEILYCDNCRLVQLGFIIDRNVIFPRSYAYITGTTKMLRDDFADLYRECTAMFDIGKEDLVVDIGSNDGTLLGNFQDKHRVLGVTPEDAGKLAIERGIPTLLEYFTPEIAATILRDHGKAKLITATNVFAHIDEVNEFTDSVLKILDEKGVFIIEVHYLLAAIQMNQFDTFYHAHLRHYSLHSLNYLLAKHGLEIVYAKQIPTHTGSIRVYAARKGAYPASDTLPAMFDAEKETILKKESLLEFKKKAILAKLALNSLFYDIKKKNGRIYGVGAPYRATMLINYTGIDEEIIDCVLEIKSSPKIGKYMPGTIIPILEESKLYADQPEYALLFSWQITDELIPKLKEKGYRGKFIVPLPTPRVIE